MNAVVLKFWKWAGNDLFNRFLAEFEHKYINEELYPEEAFEFDPFLIGKWREFEVVTALDVHTPEQVADMFPEQWPLPLNEQNLSFYRDEIQQSGIQSVATLLGLADQIAEDGDLDEIQDRLQTLATLLDAQSAAALYICLREGAVFDALWRKQFVELFPLSEALLPACAESELEHKRNQFNRLQKHLSDLPLLHSDKTFREIYENIFEAYAKLISLNDVYANLSIGPVLNQQQLCDAETELGIQIPTELRQVLLEFSGQFSFFWDLTDELREKVAYSSGYVSWGLNSLCVAYPGDYGIEDDEIEVSGWIHCLRLFDFPSGDFMAIGLDGEQAGKVYYYDHGMYSYIHIANNVSTYLLQLSKRDFCNMELVLLGFDAAKNPFAFKKVPIGQVALL